MQAAVAGPRFKGLAFSSPRGSHRTVDRCGGKGDCAVLPQLVGAVLGEGQGGVLCASSLGVSYWVPA